jgi:cell division protein FtsN
MLLLLPGLHSIAQSEAGFDEIAVFLEVPNLGAREIDVLVKDGEIFLPVHQVFDFFNIRIHPSTAFETISGFFLDRESTFSISWNTNEIRYENRLFKLKQGDLIHTETDLFLKEKYIERIFGLECNYSQKNQSVNIEPELEIPVIRELRQEDLRVNLERLAGEDESDVEVGRSYPLFSIGTADWSVWSRQALQGSAETKANLSLGSVLAGGEFTAGLTYNSSEAFRERDQHYLWRYVDNYNTTFSQIVVGKIDLLSTSTIKDPILGAKLTNTPTTLRKSSGTYTYSDKTEPNWIVELYVNNVLVGYARADASGFYTFDIPLVYGNSPIRLKFFGPYGEERTMERTISLPFAFVPKKTFEYDLSAGIVEDSLRSRILRMSANFGISRNVTIGAGYEYFTSVMVSPMMPFARGSLRLTPNLILTGEITYKVRTKGTLIYRHPSNMQLDLNYTKYTIEQQAIDHNYLEERRASILMPISLFNFSVNNRLTFHQILSADQTVTAGSLFSNSQVGEYFDNIAAGWFASGSGEDQNALSAATKYTFAEWLISGTFSGIHANITTSGLFSGVQAPTIYSTLSLSYRFASGLRITPMAQYNYSGKQLQRVKIGLEHKLFRHAYLNLSFEQDFLNDFQNAALGFRYNFNFAQTGISGIRSENRTSFIQYARGSLISDKKTNYFKADEISNAGKGGITIIPYFDENSNGRRDSGEVRISGLNLRTSSGQIERIEKDTTIRILSLEAYTKCMIEFDDSDFDSSPLKLLNRTYSVHVDPNMLKVIEVPLVIAGKASGTIRINWDGEIRELDGIVSFLYNKDRKRAGRVFSKADGTYNFEGLSLGTYVVKIDSIQLQRIGMTCTPDSINFEISSDSGRTIVTGLDFMLERTPEPKEALPKKEAPDSIQKITAPPGAQITRKDSTYIKIHELVQEVTDTTDSYAIQLGAFGRKTNATAFKDKIAAQLDREVEIVLEDGLFKVRILDFGSREEVDEFIPVLSEIGIEELWVINLRGIRQEMMLMTVRDTITEVIEIRTEMSDPDDHSNLNLQLGAFRDPDRAEALKFRLTTSLDQPVIIIEEDGYSKVRLTGFTRPEQRNAILPELAELGFTDVWVLPYDTSLYEPEIRAPEQVVAQFVEQVSEEDVVEDDLPEEEVFIQPETGSAMAVKEEIVEGVPPTGEVTGEVIKEEVIEEALAAEEAAEELIEEEIVMAEEEVLLQSERDRDIAVEDEIAEGILPPGEVTGEVIKEEVVEEALPEDEAAKEVVEEAAEEEPLIEKEKVEKPVIEQPRFSIQAGAFPELSEAKRAQRRIKSKLGLESILVQEFDFTRVLIPGFYTRRETHRYYPELAGLGYDRIMIIEQR